MPLTTHHFKPLFKNPWIQSIAPRLIPFNKIVYKRERIELPDSDFLDLDWSTPNTSSHIVVLVHGFEGSSRSSYMTSIANFLNQKGLDIVSVNLRGCSGCDNFKPYAYHSGKTEDIRAVLEVLRKTYPGIYLVGFSLGANLVLKYLADHSSDTWIEKSAVVSAPFELELSAKKIVSLPLVDQTFVKSLKKKLHSKKELFPSIFADLRVDTLKTIIDIDEHYTAKQNGFESASAYYKYASCINYIEKIATKTLIINSLDDPLLHHPIEKHDLFVSSNHVHLMLTKYGGHVGFVQNNLQVHYHHLIWDFFSC